MSLELENCFNDYFISPNELKISDNYQNDNKISKYYYIYFDEYNKRKIKKSILENLKIKHYINIGETCSICFNQIWKKKDAFLTDCGHSFHLKCIINYDYFNSFNKLGVFCPICRNDMGNYNDLKDKYKKSINYLDILDDFETNINLKLPKICFNSYELTYLNHFHRLKYNKCLYCNL